MWVYWVWFCTESHTCAISIELNWDDISIHFWYFVRMVFNHKSLQHFVFPYLVFELRARKNNPFETFVWISFCLFVLICFLPSAFLNISENIQSLPHLILFAKLLFLPGPIVSHLPPLSLGISFCCYSSRAQFQWSETINEIFTISHSDVRYE